MANKILYIATNASAGMRHFVVSILKIMFEDTAFECYAILQSEPGNDYKKDIPDSCKGRIVFMNAPRGKFQQIATLLYPKSLYTCIEKVCVKHHIDTIHFLTEDPCISTVLKSLKKKYNLYYTVHDFVTHEIQYRNVLHRMWHDWSLRKRVKKMIDSIDNLVTCSRFQYQQLVESYPHKKVYYHVFPSLVTDVVKIGGKEVVELRGIGNYVLFFGRVEKYKGVDLLYAAFKDYPQLKDEILVIAGKGNVYFDYENLPNVIWLNRFILDEEIKNLFQKAKCVVFPYISATQSGVFSFCFYFNKQVIASDIPFFREFAGSGVHLFETGNVVDLTEKLQEISSWRVGNEYERIYSEQGLRQSLLKLYKV